MNFKDGVFCVWQMSREQHGLWRLKRAPGLLIAGLVLAGCSNEPKTGPGEVRWDQEACARCVMSVSDRHYSAQVRGGPADNSGKLYKFDDIGCAVIWLDQQSWKNAPGVEVWVNDFRNGEWIDASKAFFVGGKITPMNYGLGAQSSPVEGAIDFQAARARIYDVEQTLNLHGGRKMHEHMQPKAAGK